MQCRRTAQLGEIISKGTKEAVDALQNEIDKMTTDCINIDCKPQCIGDSECPAHLGEGSLECVEKSWNAVKKNLKDEGIRDALDNGRDASIKKIKELKKCQAIKCPK